jgi:two-component system, sensor histidine kinase and response regulator
MSSETPTSATPDERTPRPLRVLVAEDNPVNQRVVQAFLEQRGHLPVLLATGREAVSALERASFDVVLMDVHMPDMDGFQATAAIRAREAAAGGHVAILAMTASGMHGDRERCLAAGMDGYITKPVRYEELIATVERAAPPPDPAAAARGAPPARPGGAGAAGDLFALFVADAVRLHAEIRDAVARRDAAALQGAAHRLHGAAGWFGAHAALALARRLEACARAGDFTAEADRACRELAAELARLERLPGADPGRGS